MTDPQPTEGVEYTQRLSRAWWKSALRPLDPYLISLRHQRLGRTLDVGCGLGRNLAVLPSGSVGVDHNATSVAKAVERGLDAVTVDEFTTRAYAPGTFDALLVSHVIEHLSHDEGLTLLHSYLPYLRHGGTMLLLCPQERGFASDPTHVRWTTGEDLMTLCRALDLQPEPWRSFPLPRWAGRAFVYNEFRVRARKP
jgi:SAM-dependent methyltransferase